VTGSPAPPARTTFVSAILLAAGASARFGSPKLLAEVGGEPILARVIRAFCSAGADQILVVIPPADGGSLHRALRRVIEAAPGSVRWRVNDRPEAGMFTSVKAGLASLDERTTHVAVSPADLPFLKEVSLRRILPAAASLGDRSLLVPTHAGRRGHPLVLPAALVPRLLSWDDGRRLSALFDEPDLAVVHMDGFGDDVLRDVDVRSDLAAAGR
jgi:molybdenum cofactor cytidylyltransferase